MGVEYRAVIALALPYEEFPDIEKVRELIDDGEVVVFSPYYDAPDEESLIGFVVRQSGDYSSEEISFEELHERKARALEQWVKFFPELEPHLYLTPYGW